MHVSTAYRSDGPCVASVTLLGEREPYTHIVCATPWIARIVNHVLNSEACGCIPDAARVAEILNEAREREVASWRETGEAA